MHLKTLTVRGFKSFALATTFRFEPGITCVVGPNGSGKSNVVDALAWVMGEQGVKSLRGGKMEDVVFAGTSGPGGRAPLGRAEVSLTIDNSDGALPIGYAEVTISRTMFRSGGSEYAINGTPARLLDVTELLSDTGIGHQMHVIVGQGQLDAVLHATPEDRRSFIEEAAGVLKHRRRKERALRKMEAMAANLARLSDLSAEVQRQLGPLARQADVARRAQVVQAQARDARGRLLADDIVQAASALAAEVADERAARAARAAAEAALATARAELAAAEAIAEEVTPRLTAAREAYFALHGVRERLRSTLTLAGERERHLRPLATPPAAPGRDVDALTAQAQRAREAEAALNERVDADRTALAAASAARGEAEAALAAFERRRAQAARALADAREALAAADARVASRASRAEAARSDAARARAALDAAAQRSAAAVQRLRELTEGAGGQGGAGGGAGEAGGGPAGRTQALAEALAEAEDGLARARSAERDAERDRAGAAARAEALELGLRERRDGTGALLAHGGRLPGVMGPLAAALTIEPGAEDVVAAALGAAADAVAVESVEAAVDALRLLRSTEAGRAELVVADGLESGSQADGAGAGDAGHAAGAGDAEHAESGGEDGSVGGAGGAGDVGGLPGGVAVRSVAGMVSAPPELRGALARLLVGVVAVAGLGEARAVLAARGDLTVVTEQGDVLHAVGARGGAGAGGAPSRLHVQTALDEARSALAEALARGESARAALESARADVARCRGQVAEHAAAVQARDAAAAAVARAVGEASGAARAASAEVARAEQALRRALDAVAGAEEGLGQAGDAHERAAAAVAALLDDTGDDSGHGSGTGSGQGSGHDSGDGTVDDGAGEVLAAAAQAARAAEVEARLALRTDEERQRAGQGRAESLERAAGAERARAQQAAAAADRAAGQLAIVVAVRDGAASALAVARQAVLTAGLRRDDAETDAVDVTERLAEARAAVEAGAAAVAALTDSVHRDELARAERTARLDALAARCREELGTDPEALVAELGPDRPVPVLDGGDGGDGGDDGDGGDGEQGAPYVRAEQEERLRRAERDLARLGKVNPLALEEFEARTERAAFLTRQLDDLRTARADLLDIVRQVDERVQEVFTAAFADTAAAFEVVFARLFPGGQGRLVLTDPDDPLSSGVEVEARPAGKRVKRLSLLSGGERSLTAVALLIAIFRARPSPFYVLDEVEAALDDANLRRLLEVLRELSRSSQLIVVTHQERTMSIADALYGVSMRTDGVSAVVSQRLRENLPEGAGVP